MLPTPIWPLAEHASLGQNCFDASIGSVWFCILDSMPVDACFCKSSFPFHRLVELYQAKTLQRKWLLLIFCGLIALAACSSLPSQSSRVTNHNRRIDAALLQGSS